MVIKFRLIEDSNSFMVEVKTFFGWTRKQTDFGLATLDSRFETEEHAIARVYSDCKLKKELITAIRYPNLQIVK